MEIHYKVTTWKKIIFPEKVTKEEVIKALEEGNLPEDLYQIFTGIEHEDILEVDDFVTLEDNDGESTIELFQERFDSTPIWDNSYASEAERLLLRDKENL